MQYRTLYPEGNFYTGNLHTHSTVSDGGSTPEEVAAYYRDVAKRNFLAITDHHKFRMYPELSSENFLMIPGVELNTVWTENDRSDHHIVGIYVEGESDAEDGTDFGYICEEGVSAQEIVDELNRHKMMAFLAHPFWSHAKLDEPSTLNGIIGMEIMNHACETICHDGAADVYYSETLRSGKRIWCLATDDAHQMNDIQVGGYIAVKCAELSNKAIIKAIREGSFYASTGAVIKDVYVEGGVLHLDCEDIVAAYAIAGRAFNNAHATKEAPLTHCEWNVPKPAEGEETFVRVVVINSKGEKAWSEPIYYRAE